MPRLRLHHPKTLHPLSQHGNLLSIAFYTIHTCDIADVVLAYLIIIRDIIGGIDLKVVGFKHWRINRSF